MNPLYLLTALVALGVAAQWGASRLRVPAILPLLGMGILLGPVFGQLDPEELFGSLLEPGVKLAVAIVLLEGGLSLRISEVRRVGAPLLALVLGGLVISSSLTAFAAHSLAGLSWPTSWVLGAVLVVTGPTVIKPMLRQARLSTRPALLLKWESIVNDALGALLAVVLLELATHDPATGFPGWRIGLLLVTAGVAGFVSGWFLGLALRRGWLPEHLKASAILAGGLVVFTASDALFHESGLLAVTVMGIVLANVQAASLEDVRRFKEDVATLLVALLFLVLSAGLEMEHLQALTGGSLVFILSVLFVVRPVTVWASLTPFGVPWRERALLGWLAPRGVVAAAMGGALAPRLLAAGYEDAELLVPILFAVVIATVVLHGLTAAPFAQRLGVAAPGEVGLLIVGVSRWSLDFALAAQSIGVEVLMADPTYRSVSRARLRGLEAYRAEVLDEEDLDDLPFERVGVALVATEDDHYNALASLALSRPLGRDHVYQVPCLEEDRDPSLQGLTAWDNGARYGDLTTRAWTSGRAFKTTELNAERNDWESFTRRWPEARVLLVATQGKVTLPSNGEAPEGGARIVFLPRPGQTEALELDEDPPQ